MNQDDEIFQIISVHSHSIKLHNYLTQQQKIIYETQSMLNSYSSPDPNYLICWSESEIIFVNKIENKIDFLQNFKE